MNAPNLPLLPGFGDPVDDAQRVFRVLLDALAGPGRPLSLGEPLQVPPPFATGTGAILLALADYETPLWLQTPDGEAAAWLRFHCGAPLVEDPAQARFAVVDRPADMPPLSAFAQGEPEYPDRATTLIVQVPGFRDDGLCLEGPGIPGTRPVGIDGLPSAFWAAWREGRARAPLGVDVFFVAGDRVLGLPRSTRVVRDEAARGEG
jgi:alpha-D-ribose 1-methylphosphonate 5-triphosphate synthase subunit PhnH